MMYLKILFDVKIIFYTQINNKISHNNLIISDLNI